MAPSIWDLPQALQDKGGSQSRDTAQAFADYASLIAEQLGDRVKHFFTLNELQNFVDMGHRGTEIKVQGKDVRIELAPACNYPLLRSTKFPTMQCWHMAWLFSPCAL